VKLFLVLTMERINECCDPLRKAKLNHVRSNLILIQNKRNAKLKKFINLYMCRPCEKAIYKLIETELNSTLEKKELKKKESENVCVDKCEQKSVDDSEDFSETKDNEMFDPEFKCSDSRDRSISKINEILINLGEPPLKKKCSAQLTKQDKHNIKTALNKLIDENIAVTDDFENQDQLYVNNIKEILSKEETRSRKIRVLTTLPADWSKKRIRREFNISRRMVSQAKALAVKSGFASEPPKKKGKKLLESTREKVLDFYLSDDF